MIYVFGITLIYVFIRERKQLLQSSKNLIIYLLLAILAFAMGVVYLCNPYLPSISLLLEKYLK